ncbi:hypothetical protein pdam_00024118 [Pocillopora damicornis]|uniref:Uncharacterized protein n=1 Tax=Pocillopora damicornis TaxID=46731 RepID=A0A3M6U7Q7_POCDA|nr:hypothetical protein pdam_00024118 [Pocillopora damicornis]
MKGILRKCATCKKIEGVPYRPPPTPDTPMEQVSWNEFHQAHNSEKQNFSLHITTIEANCFPVLCNSLFSTVTPTTWSVGHIIPAHASDVFQKYNLGLNRVSMEG